MAKSWWRRHYLFGDGCRHRHRHFIYKMTMSRFMHHERRQVVTVRMTTDAIMRSLVLCKSLVTPPFDRDSLYKQWSLVYIFLCYQPSRGDFYLTNFQSYRIQGNIIFPAFFMFHVFMFPHRPDSRLWLKDLVALYSVRCLQASASLCMDSSILRLSTYMLNIPSGSWDIPMIPHSSAVWSFHDHKSRICIQYFVYFGTKQWNKFLPSQGLNSDHQLLRQMTNVPLLLCYFSFVCLFSRLGISFYTIHCAKANISFWVICVCWCCIFFVNFDLRLVENLQ